MEEDSKLKKSGSNKDNFYFEIRKSNIHVEIHFI